MVEEGANALWPSGEAAHVVDDSLLELPLAAGERPSGDRLLDIAVQAFVWVEVRAVGREVENFDLILTSVQPRAHQSCPVHLQAVEDEENLAAGAADQALEEADQARGLDRAVEDHPTQLASICQRRDQAHIGPPVVGANHRGLTAWGVAPAAHVVRAQAALVAPEDHSLLRLGPRRDRRVLPAQPAPYCGRVLLVGPPQRLLRRVAPARQVAAHGPHRHSDAEALPDQRLHRRPAPEREVQPQRIRHLLADQDLDLRLLLCRQQTAVSWRRPTPLAFQPRRATLRKALANVKDPGRGQPNLGRDRRIGLPRLAQPNHLPPSLLLRLRRQAPHVYVLHCSGYLGTAGKYLKNTGAGSIKSDTRPLPAADGAYAFGIVDQEVPGLSASVDDVVVGVPDPGAELVLSQVVPDGFHRVQLGTVGRQGEQGEIGRYLQLLAPLMPSRPVADQDSVRRRGNLRADFLQVQVHRLGIGIGHDHRGADATRRADRAE